MADTSVITLNNGVEIPQLGLGVWQASPAETEAAVRFAIAEAGYRHIDTAAAYRNEEAVGRGIAASRVPRDEVFVTTKLWNSDHGADRAGPALDASLRRLGLDHVDLVLIHWPLQDAARRIETWLALEAALGAGKARAIGVSNFTAEQLEEVIAAGSIVPAVNQVELHARFPQQPLRAFCRTRGIAVESWSPLGGAPGSWGGETNTLLGDPIVAAVARRHERSPAQVLIRWHLQQGLIAIPKSVHPDRIRQNIEVFDFELDAGDLLALASLETGERIGADPLEANWGARPTS